MNVLHLYSDWKWTGPAEPVLQMCSALQERGHRVTLAHGQPDIDYPESVGSKADEYRVDHTTRFRLDRHLPPGPTLRDLFGLPRYIREQQIDVVHTHLCHDHAIAGLCTRFMPRERRPLVVRTLHRRSVLPRTLGYRVQLRHLTDAWLTFTESFRQAYIERFGLPADRVFVQPMTIDTERFAPTWEHAYTDMRAAFGIPAGAPVIGIVGRFQKYRRMDIFLPAAQQVLAQSPDTHFLIIGRSSQIQDTVVNPSAELGIEKQIKLTGYRTADYADILASLDIFTLLMPGFDGTARAVREAMSLGKPCVVSDYGMLPDIVPHAHCGLVTPLDPTALANAWLRLLRSPDERMQFGRNARAKAETAFQITTVAPALEAAYRAGGAVGRL